MHYMKNMQTPPITVVETPTFVNKVGRLMDDEGRKALIDFLARNPEGGKVIEGTGGVRKVRWARENEGSSGGFRIIYYFYNLELPLFAITLYSKSEKENLTKGEKNAIKRLVEKMIEDYKESLRLVSRRK